MECAPAPFLVTLRHRHNAPRHLQRALDVVPDQAAEEPRVRRWLVLAGQHVHGAAGRVLAFEGRTFLT